MDASAHFGTWGCVMGRVLARLAFAGLAAAAIVLGAQSVMPALGQAKKLSKVDRHHVARPRRDPKVNLSVNMHSQRRAMLILLPGGHGRLKIVKGKFSALRQVPVSSRAAGDGPISEARRRARDGKRGTPPKRRHQRRAE